MKNSKKTRGGEAVVELRQQTVLAGVKPQSDGCLMECTVCGEHVHENDEM